MVSVSIVSHGHGDMVSKLISQLLGFSEISQIILTLNIPEVIEIPSSSKLRVIKNIEVAGFAKNHNRAFSVANNNFFCVLNPDVSFLNNPFTFLLAKFVNYDISLVAPMVVSTLGGTEDSIRYFPTPLSIAKKLILKKSGQYSYDKNSLTFSPEWVAGMFMLFKSQNYAELGGFDERYYLYYEDVDICTRIWRSGGSIIAEPRVQIIHDARRTSRINLQYFRWHVLSMMRYFFWNLWRLPKVKMMNVGV